MSTVAGADPAAARAALSRARMLRAENLIALSEGVLIASEVVAFAATAEGEPLRRISLRQLLISQPGVGVGAANVFLAKVADRLGLKEDLNKRTIGWLIDVRACGRRLLVWRDAEQPRVAPWPGFPWVSQPYATATRSAEVPAALPGATGAAR